MVNAAHIFNAKVMHKRFFPKVNSFNYSVYYLALPLPAPALSSRLLSFDPKDLGKRDGTDPTLWARELLGAHDNLNDRVKKITLVTMPRVLGYIFNPVSFYFCYNNNEEILAVICEVHNTFGEQHTYLCVNSDQSPITSNQWLAAEKIFHVSPFLERTGSYKFRFDFKSKNLGIWIDYYDENKRKQLATSLTGSLTPLTKQSIRQAFWRHPLVTLKAISLIHWQALRLLLKGIKYVPKPVQNTDKISLTISINKM